MTRKNRPMKFAMPEAMAAAAVLDDYDVARPWKVLSGGAAQRALDEADEIEEVGIRLRHDCLINHVVAAANGVVFLFVLR